MTSPPRSDEGGLPSPDKNKGEPTAGGGIRPSPEVDDELTGVPGFRTWWRVYLFVFGFFVAVVIALTVFTRVFE